MTMKRNAKVETQTALQNPPEFQSPKMRALAMAERGTVRMTASDYRAHILQPGRGANKPQSRTDKLAQRLGRRWIR